MGRLLAASVPDLRHRPFFASPLSRALETARLLRGAAGLPPESVTIDERLAELAFGDWEGATMRELRTRDPHAMRVRDAERWSHRPPGGESYEDVERRLTGFFASLVEPSVVVAHGGVIRAALSLLSDTPRSTLPALHIRQGRAIVLAGRDWRWL